MKITQDILKRALELQIKIKTAQNELDDINKEIKERGSFALGNYIVSVVDVERNQLAGLSIFEQAGYKSTDLIKEGLLKTISYKTVKITEKAA